MNHRRNPGAAAQFDLTEISFGDGSVLEGLEIELCHFLTSRVSAILRPSQAGAIPNLAADLGILQWLQR